MFSFKLLPLIALSLCDFAWAQSCSTPQGGGDCQNTSACNGKSIPGYCPGPTEYQCCVADSSAGDKPDGDGDSCSTPSGSGTCKSTSSCSGGNSIPGYCDGPEEIQCCVTGSSDNGAPPPATSDDSHPINEASISLLKKLEGFRSHFYYINGDKTIGYGHDCTQRGDCANIPDPISKTEGEKLFRKDLVGYENSVCKQPNAKKLNANQYGAFVSFTYNCGAGGLEESLGIYFDSGDFDAACDALPSKRTLGGQLTGRRNQEKALCNSPTSAKSGC